ncbi:ATP-binding domain-containing protein [Ravibacter arvi]|uniref:ATP-binding domain-containing protein n=1 Tax=Ravibacter arvi TaxID=2051041 RepID=A0ABP8M7E5_9BACT
MIERNDASRVLAASFPFTPTQSQERFFQKMNVFLDRASDGRAGYDCFVLKGYAGTGKTTLVSVLVKVVKQFGYQTVLLAPTGRAAKVMSAYSGRKSFTIHRKIYRPQENGTESFSFVRQANYHKDTLFIVDEASMISDEAVFGSRGLLSDLLAYVREGSGNKIIFVGDTAQLPPVGTLVSPALDLVSLEKNFGVKGLSEELVDVMRQTEGSGILWNATALRSGLNLETPEIRLSTRPFRDVYRMTSGRLEDGLRYAYDKFGEEDTIILTRSNKDAVLYNQYIRRVIHFAEDELDAGERLMIVRNNYRVLGDDTDAGFLANGDFVELLKVRRMEEMHGFRFANVTLRLTDYDQIPSFETKILLDTLYTPTPSLSAADNKKLYESVLADYADIASRKERMEAIRNDPYLNALQVKFAYALTCHKAQGGQWSSVFVDQGYLPENQAGIDFLRWVYTAVTRATKELYLVNFHDSFFDLPERKDVSGT